MKAVCSKSVDVELPVGRVFGFVADIERWPVWLSFVVSAQQRAAPPQRRIEPAQRKLAVDEEIQICMQRGKRRWHETFDVIRFVPNAFVWLEGSLSASRRIEFRFEQRRDGTRVHCAVGYPVFGLAGRLSDALFTRRGVSHDLHHSMMHLKTVLEDVDPEVPERENANQALLA